MTRLYHPALSAHPEEQYLDMLRDLLSEEKTRETRNDVGTRSLFGRQTRWDMADGFPLLTTKKVFWKGVVVELLWMIRGETNVKALQEEGVTIWDKWADEHGELGPVYGAQWRRAPGLYQGSYLPGDVDQLANAINGLKTNPHSRRHMVDSWNPAQVDDMALPPCHCLFQFYVGSDQRLSLQLYQRSADIFLGVPFNLASYALLLHIVAAMLGREPGEFIHTFGDYHLYGNHEAQAATQAMRAPFQFPTLEMEGIDTTTTIADLMELKSTQFKIVDYQSHAGIKGEASK